ncbi:MAG: trigger factor [Actinomycetota bacterium]|nr:trigger factor [Actinomycetota bacterium]
MAGALTTTTRELGDSRVRIEVEVGPEAVEREVERAARTLAGELKVPGFRKGKVPPPVVLQRVGREAVLDEAVRRALPDWYQEAIGEAGVVTVGDPKLDLDDLPERGAPLEFSIEVGVRPRAQLGPYDDLEVARREPQVAEEDVEREIDRLRESVASLEAVDRPAGRGDFLVLDYVGTLDGEPFEGGEARGQLLELGSGRLIEGFEQQLQGASAGEEREVRVTFPDDYRAEHLAGREAVFRVTVKEVKEKRLPEPDDDFAVEAGGLETLEELRADIRRRLEEAQARQIDVEFREAAVDAAAEAATIDVPKALVHAKAHEMWGQTVRRLRAQGVDPEQFLQVSGKTEHDVIEEGEPEAERLLRRESVLAAIVEAEGIEVSDDELLESLRRAATAGGDQPPDERKLRRSLEQARTEGRDELLRQDIAMRKAVDLLVERARPVPAEQAAAREKLWTPEQGGERPAGELWTPGSPR